MIPARIRPAWKGEDPHPGAPSTTLRASSIGSRRRWLRWTGCWASAWVWSLGRRLEAAEGKTEDLSAIAVFVLKIVGFTTWPEDAFAGPDEPYRLVIAGQDPFGPRIDEVVRGEKVRGRGFVVRRSKTGEGLEGCHMVFVGNGEDALMRRVIQAVAGRPVLLLGTRPGFCAAGGMVTFRTERARIAMDIHLAAVTRARLVMEARLLDVANIYRENGNH